MFIIVGLLRGMIRVCFFFHAFAVIRFRWCVSFIFAARFEIFVIMRFVIDLRSALSAEGDVQVSSVIGARRRQIRGAGIQANCQLAVILDRRDDN